MAKYFQIFIQSFTGYFNYLISEITFQYDYKAWYENYFYWLILVSLTVWFLEIGMPWRKNQNKIRKDFWLDVFYMFFNFFLVSLIGYNALSNMGVELFNDFLKLLGYKNIILIQIGHLPRWTQYLLLFVVADFIQWNIHRLLHRFDALWSFHKVHHSVKEMGFAAHLRFHFMETILYKTIQFIPLSMLGYSITNLFWLHITTVLIGHLNHANLNWDYGWFRYIFNNPKMHIWHHVKVLPQEHRFGVNFGLSLSLWDYWFKTAYLPKDGRDIELGFDDDEHFPKQFRAQMTEPFKSS
ncbi:MAG: hypothetical protein RLZZ628_3199 [Bacteroidota bacterium]|jgi:sterol desaturase/sphingolipid hydroxylase (fatty acid hydroxylase superfamily)